MFNCSLCAPFRVHRGIQLGWVLSGMLYSLSLEPLLSKTCTNIGLIIPDFKKIVSSAYADDIIALVRNQMDVDVLANLT